MVTLSLELQEGELLEPTPVIELRTASRDNDSAPSLTDFQLVAQTQGRAQVDNIIADRNTAEEESEDEEAVESSGTEDASTQAEGDIDQTRLSPSAVQTSLHTFMVGISVIASYRHWTL